MFNRYKLKCDKSLENLIENFEEIGKSLNENTQKTVSDNLRKYIREDGYIDFVTIQEEWFPTIEADIFISHSHNDMKVVNALVGWLTQELKLKVFVDSYIWKSCDDLLYKIDKKFCLQSDQKTFDYHKRNFSTTQVHMTLANALHKMIDRTECIIFLETENSLSLNTDIEKGTSSAWIYSELVMSNLLRENLPKRYLKKSKEEREKFYNITESFNPLFRSDKELSQFTLIEACHLQKVSQYNLVQGHEYLDELYKLLKNK
ncbi:hypothetical protein [Clostridium sp.]|uniref:hypothetical protein n=1 Tax=Clostridium sp. TaxID=1506 RepID=UPI0039935DFF